MSAQNNFTIKRVSFSRLAEFENCAWATKLKVIDRVPEPERPLPPGKTEHANDRGSRIHDECEKFVRGQGPLPQEAKEFAQHFDALKGHFEAGRASLEGEWGFTVDWLPCDYNAPEVWLRVKADAVVWLSKKRAVVIDYKTGRKFGNEIKHAEQVQLYAMAVMIRCPDVEVIDVELWYLDQDELTHAQKPTTKWIRHLKPFDARFKRMSAAKTFKPAANKISCRWCPYREGICPHAVK